MNRRSSIIMMFVLAGVLFLNISSIYAETAEEMFNKGIEYSDQKKYDEAITEFNKVIANKIVVICLW